MAAALSDQHRSAEALEEYKRVAAMNPNYQGLNFNIGLEQARLGLADDAIASLLKQREVADDLDTENLLTEVYTRKGMQREADDARRRAAEMIERK